MSVTAWVAEEYPGDAEPMMAASGVSSVETWDICDLPPEAE